jgi:hypothetical protein
LEILPVFLRHAANHVSFRLWRLICASSFTKGNFMENEKEECIMENIDEDDFMENMKEGDFVTYREDPSKEDSKILGAVTAMQRDEATGRILRVRLLVRISDAPTLGCEILMNQFMRILRSGKYSIFLGTVDTYTDRGPAFPDSKFCIDEQNGLYLEDRRRRYLCSGPGLVHTDIVTRNWCTRYYNLEIYDPKDTRFKLRVSNDDRRRLRLMRRYSDAAGCIMFFHPDKTLDCDANCKKCPGYRYEGTYSPCVERLQGIFTCLNDPSNGFDHRY